MKTELYVSPQMDVVQLHLDQAVLAGSAIGSSEGGIELTLKGFGEEETAW